MNWINLRAEFAEPLEDPSAVHEVFARHGLEATVEHDDPPGMSAYFCEDESSNRLLAEVGEALFEFGAVRVEASRVPEEDWSESWKQFFVPREIGARFVLKPTWEDIEATERIVIELDPGQAFGTGEHATTQLCLVMLEEAVEAGDTVIDLGCGSGVLSIAAAKLGATVFATEADAAAASVAEGNCRRNGVDVRIETTSEVPDGFPKADVVVSNIVSATLIRLAPEVARRLVDDGVWIASGIIPDNLTDVVAAAQRVGFELATTREQGGWVGVVFRRPVN